MPRVSDAEKQKSHKRILEAAAGLFREKGIETTSVAEVMKAAGMTHGGFYRHFSGKDEMVSAAFDAAVDDAVADMEQGADGAARAAARADYIAKYLSQNHVENRNIGCPIAALGSELARSEGPVKQDTANAIDRVAELLEADATDQSGYARLALLVGAVTLARLTGDETQSKSILEKTAATISKLT
ncbi:TetR/AcrR family transcriptional regulator [uncultured Litoreibacter sp.]|uniref:TetR/AcrR family transcriptional regulator n=1 Tax=uncultured Litoreibacter sp. TaxID=1392394 RepID=UPI0026216B59|nr:TetR/AcrR family transcriptional regulator [uncultured Litoreibacter sp.]